MGKATSIITIAGVGVGLYLLYIFLQGKNGSSAANNVGQFFGNTIASTAFGVGTGIANAINPNNPVAMQQNNTIRAAFGLTPDTPGNLNYPFTNIPIDTTQQNNDIRSFFGLLPENNNVQYYPFTNIPIGRTA